MVIFVSCSTMIMEPAEPMVGNQQHSEPLKTRALSGGGEPIDDAVILHYYQTNHRMILMRHVELRDTIYVQTLTEDDMTNLHITEEERSFGDAYVIQLNELLKQ